MNTTLEVLRGTDVKFAFNWSVESTAEAVKRVLHLTDVCSRTL